MEALLRLKELDVVLTAQIMRHKQSQGVSEWFFHFPLPAWLKDLEGKVIALNPAYGERYGIEPDVYLEARDSDAWGRATALEFHRNDAEVAREERPKSYVETVTNPKTGQREQIYVLKFPVYDATDLIGVGGIAIYIPPR